MPSLFSQSLSLLFLLLSSSFASQTQTVTVLEKPGLTTTITSGHVTAPPASLSTSTISSSVSTSTSTSTSSSTSSTSTSTSTSTSSHAVYPSASSPADSGASGPSDSFGLSTGGTIAIIVVVVAVVIIGLISTVLFVLARRRQWKIRGSIKRASRRLTGRKPPSANGRHQRPQTDGKRKRPGTMVAHPPGQKRGLVVEVKDVEKGQAGPSAAEQRSSEWNQRLRGNRWA